MIVRFGVRRRCSGRYLPLLAALLLLAGPGTPPGGDCQGSSSDSDSDSSADEPVSSSAGGHSSEASFYGFYGAHQRAAHRSAHAAPGEDGPQRRSGTTFVPGRTKRQVAFALLLPGITVREVSADAAAYAQLAQRLNRLLDNAVAELGHSAQLPRWYHKLGASKDGSSLEVGGVSWLWEPANPDIDDCARNVTCILSIAESPLCGSISSRILLSLPRSRSGRTWILGSTSPLRRTLLQRTVIRGR